MRYILSESPGRGKWCSPDLFRIKLSASAGFEVTQQISKDVPSLPAIHWVLVHLRGGVRSHGVIRERPAKFIKSKQTKIWLCEGRTLHSSGMRGGHLPDSRSTEFCPRFFHEPYLSRVGLRAIRRGGGTNQVWRKVWGESLAPESHNSIYTGSCQDLGKTRLPGVGRVELLGTQRWYLVDLL